MQPFMLDILYIYNNDILSLTIEKNPVWQCPYEVSGGEMQYLRVIRFSKFQVRKIVRQVLSCMKITFTEYQGITGIETKTIRTILIRILKEIDIMSMKMFVFFQFTYKSDDRNIALKINLILHNKRKIYHSYLSIQTALYTQL